MRESDWKEMKRKKIVKFVDKRLIKGFFYNSTTENNYFSCPCCNHSTSFYSWEDDENHYPFEPYRKCFGRFLRHLDAKIRLSGDKKHILLLIKIFGQKESYRILNKMANKNMMVALRLKSIVNKLKLQIVNQIQSTKSIKSAQEVF